MQNRYLELSSHHESLPNLSACETSSVGPLNLHINLNRRLKALMDKFSQCLIMSESFSLCESCLRLSGLQIHADVDL